MSDMRTRVLPDNFRRGPIQGSNIIGETTEALHRFLLDGWNFDTPPPRIEEDLSFVPKDREEVLYVYMYRCEQNDALKNTKRWSPAKITVFGEKREDRVLMRLYDATHLVYRPRRYILPNGEHVDSTGSPWSVDADGDDVIMEKVAMALVDDLTLGDAINFFTINEAPFRPYLTYRAQCSMEGPLISGPATTVRHHRMKNMERPAPSGHRPNGRLGRAELRPSRDDRTQIGPPGFAHRPIEDNTSED
jgi:hypothetical protein